MAEDRTTENKKYGKRIEGALSAHRAVCGCPRPRPELDIGLEHLRGKLVGVTDYTDDLRFAGIVTAVSEGLICLTDVLEIPQELCFYFPDIDHIDRWAEWVRGFEQEMEVKLKPLLAPVWINVRAFGAIREIPLGDQPTSTVR